MPLKRNDDQDQREEATGTSAVCKPRLPSIIVIGSRSIIVTTLSIEVSTDCVRMVSLIPGRVIVR